MAYRDIAKRRQRDLERHRQLSGAHLAELQRPKWRIRKRATPKLAAIRLRRGDCTLSQSLLGHL